MTLFLLTLSRMAILASFVLIGFVVARLGCIPKGAAAVLSKLENTVFIPALVAGTFLTNFTKDTLGRAGEIFLFSLVLNGLLLLLAHLLARLLCRDDYIRRITTYGLAFSNFGFFGIPVVGGLFPEYTFEYIVFTLPLWIFIYLYGVPYLLMENTGERRRSFLSHLRPLLNPMFVGLLIGALVGILSIPLPEFMLEVVDSLGGCMSPIAMMITGITFAGMPLVKVLKNPVVYTSTLLRLLLIPIAVGGLLLLADRLGMAVPEATRISTICAMAMPLGLNTVVIPAAYGRDTSVAAGMALVSHLLAIATIPLILGLFL